MSACCLSSDLLNAACLLAARTVSRPSGAANRIRGRAGIRCLLLALLGPVVAWVQAAPVFPHFASLAGGDDAPSQLQQQLLGGGTGERVGGGVGQAVGDAPA